MSIYTGPRDEDAPMNTAGDTPTIGSAIALESKMVRPGSTGLHVMVSGADGAGGPIVCFVHGNLSSSRFFSDTMASLPSAWRVVAPDLRGFGRSAPAPVDATRGVRDFADDVGTVLDDPAVVAADRPVHLVGWSLGGGVVMQYAIEHADRVASVTLIATISPFGFGGTRDVGGSLCYEDGAGSGGGIINPEFVRHLVEGDSGEESDLSPRSVLRSLYLNPSFQLSPQREDLFVDEILATALGDDNYPGTQRSSAHWPGVGPGTRGVGNAMSPLFCDLSGFDAVVAARPVLWVHGSDDLIVSDHSALDFGQLGADGVIPGWPGAEFPPQPMVSQIRAMLGRGEQAGGNVVEVIFEGSGHSPHLEQPERFCQLLTRFVTDAEASRG
jgi:pimeloyl-ACP methyl ester carboxylesterase